MATPQFLVPFGYVVLTSDPSGPVEGQTYYNSTSDKVRVYDGLQWRDVGGNSPALVAAFSQGGTIAVKTGGGRFYITDTSVTIVSVRASVGTAPTGASIIVDVNKNGTTIFTTQSNRPTIAVSTNTSGAVTNMDVTTMSSGDYFTVDIDQIGSTVAGSDLTVQIRYVVVA